MARIRRLSGATPLTPNDRAIAAEAADRLLAGELIILPTDTVYGLFLHSTAPEAIARLERLKHRPQPKPLAALLREDERLVAFMRGTVEPLAGGAAEKLIPGALTLIAPFAEWRGLLPPELAALPRYRRAHSGASIPAGSAGGLRLLGAGHQRECSGRADTGGAGRGAEDA
jgi:hypothetical protein